MDRQEQIQNLLRALERAVNYQILAEEHGDKVLALFYAELARELREELKQKYDITFGAGEGHERQATTHRGATDSNS